MNQKSRRITITVLAIALALVLTAGLCTFFVRRTHHAGEAVLSEEDFEYGYASSLAYGADTQETSEGAYGWGYQPSKEAAEYAYITKIDHTKLQDLLNEGVTKLVLNIPTEHNGVPVKFIKQDAFADCTMTIVDIHMPLSVYWEINKSTRFTLNNQFAFARADGETATFTAFEAQSGTGADKQPITTLVLPSNVWINEDDDNVMDDDEPRYRYTEYLFEGESNTVYTNLVVMPDVVNIFNGKGDDSPKMQGGLLSKSKNLKSVYFCTGRSEVLHLYPLTFENCTSLTEISLSAGVYLEDGARVFQGSSALEKFTIAEEKSASAPLFYTVGADGALYTNDYAYTHFSQSNMEKYYEWWKKGNPASGYESEISPSKAYDSELQIEEKRLEEDNSETKTHNDFLGDSSSSSSDDVMYYAKGSSGRYNSGIGIPAGSYVFDVNGTDKSSNVDNENDFTLGEGEGQYDPTADFKSATLTTISGTNSGGTKASISTGSSEVTVTEMSGSNQSGATITVDGVEYKSRIQLKKSSGRYLKIEVPFDFELCAYFAGSYAATEVGSSHPQLALFSELTGDAKSYTAKTSDMLATLSDVERVSISGASHLLKVEKNTLTAGTYYIAQPSDDAAGDSGGAQMYFLVITPSKTQTADRLVIEQALQTDPGEENWGALTEDDWEVVQNDSLLLSVSRDEEQIVDRRHPTLFVEEGEELLFRMRLLTAAGEPIRSQKITGSIKAVDGEKMYGSYVVFQKVRNINEDGYFTFTLSFGNNAYDWDALSRKPKVAVIEFTTDGITKKLYFNFTAAAGMDQSKIPNPDKFASGAAETTPMYLPLVDERAGRYQTLVSMPAKAKNADTSESEYVNFFDFDYRETVEIGPNAFQNTYITVIDIPDRIAKIGASAFRFSERLQTVYLPDKTEIALNAFGQEADADTVNKTVFTAGKKNFFLIAPSRASYEMYMEASEDSGDDNYNTFPIHVEAEVQGFDKRAGDSGRGKDASYDYTPYLTYEISVNFLTYDGDTITGTETRSFLYGKDARFVKATATTEWAVYDDLYDNNAPVYFGYISDGKVQQINTLPTDIPWSVAANGWYYDEDAAFPEGDWYFGETEVFIKESAEKGIAEMLTDFFNGNVSGTAVNGFSFENRAQIHYAEVYSATSGVKGVTQTGKDAGDLRHAITEKSIENGEDDPKWVWDEEAHEGLGAIYETHSTMPFSVILRSKSQAPDTKIALEVPDFQRIGEVTLDNEVINILERGPEVNDSWKVPQLTVTFDFNGFAPSRIFEGFNSSAMKVTYLTEYSYNTGIKDERGYDIWGSGWASNDPADPYTGECNFDAWSYHGVPYNTGTYLIKVTLNEALGDYQYVWGGDYNGVHVNANDTSAKYFLLYIQTRNVHVSGTPTYVPYTGEEWDIFANNPYYGAGYSIVKSDLVRDESGNPIVGSFGPNGLPCGAGAYTVYLGTYDPKYSGSSDSGYNLAFVGNGIKGTSVEITLYIVDEPIYDSYEYGTYDEPHGDRHTTVFEAPMAQIEDHANSFVYNGAPISLEDVFNQHFVESATEYSITRNGVHVTEIKDVGTYVVTVKPAEGYIWWRGEEVDHYVYLAWDWSGYIHDGWKLDEFWESLDGSGKYDADPDKYDKYYEEFKTATLTFEFTVDPRPISVPQDSFVPVGVDPPYIFAAPIGGDYEVVGYHLHDFETGEIPKASESAQWSSVIIESGVYDVLLRLTDPVNCTWYPDAGEPHGGNYYQTARLYASFDREKAYAVMNDDLGTVTGASGAESWVTLTRTYDGEPLVADLNVGNVLATLFKSAPTAEEVRIAIYKLSAAPVGIGGFVGEEASAIEDAGYYGVIVTLNDPFVYAGTGATAAYYLVHIEEAEIGRNTGSSFEWEREHLFRADDEGIELKLPDDSTASDYPLTLVSPARNGVTVTYHLETHEEKDHDPDLIAANLASLRAGEDPFEGDWYEYSEEKLRVKNPLGYCVYVKVEAPNHETYYDYISLHIFHEELKITLRTDVGSSVPYGDSVHTQAALRTAVFDAIESITVSGNDGNLGGRENMKDDLTQDYFFFYFMKDGKEYDIEESEETYLDVGTYDLYVRYSGPVLGTAEETTHFIRFSWENGRPQFTITARELTLDLGAIAGHTYLDMPASPWYEHQIVTYKGAEENAIVTRDGTKDDPQISIFFEKDGESYPSLNAISSAGTYTVRAVCGNPNYAVRLAEAYTYTVAPRTLTVEAFPSVPYDGTEHKPTVVFGGLLEHVVLLETDYTLSFVPPAGVALGENGLPLAAGSYQATVTLNSNNYAFAEGSSYTAAFVIEYTSLDLPYLSPTSFPYTGEDLRGDVTAALGNYIPAAMTVSFFTTDDGTGTALERVVDAGTYFVKLTLTDGNYRWRDASEIFLSFTVSRRTQPSLTLTASDAEATYGDSGDALRPAVSGVPQGFDVSYLYTYEGVDGTEYARSDSAPVNVGKYLVTITVVYAGGVNDEPFTATATAHLTILARALTFSLDPAEGAGGLIGAVFKDGSGNAVALAATDYSFAYSFGGTAVESMTKAGEYTVTVTLIGEAAVNNRLVNATAVYTLTQDLSGDVGGGDVGGGDVGGDVGGGDEGGEVGDDFDVGAAIVLMGVQVILLAVVFGLAVRKKRTESVNAEEGN